jgi:tRNA (cmo5U34)-methyltransferase
MLNLAERSVQAFADRAKLIEGVIDDVPDTLFDGATCLLTLHFLPAGERLRTLQEIRRRLRPGAKLVIAHHSSIAETPEHWMALSAAFGDSANLDWPKSIAIGKTMSERLPLMNPIEEEHLLQEAGYWDVALFYAALSFRGWVASAG